MNTKIALAFVAIALALLTIFGFARIAAAPESAPAATPEHTSNTPKMFDITLTIDGVAPTTKHTILEGVTALSLAQTVSQVRNFEFITKTYPGMGTLVEQINTIKNGQDGKYWHYYINGALAPVAADTYVIQNGDVIEWRFHEPDTSM